MKPELMKEIVLKSSFKSTSPFVCVIVAKKSSFREKKDRKKEVAA
jgi:hypothetical protein